MTSYSHNSFHFTIVYLSKIPIQHEFTNSLSFFLFRSTESQIVDNASSQSSSHSQDPQSQQRQYNYADNNTDDLTWDLAEFVII